MIGVCAKADEKGVVEEFFQLFKTPWEVFQGGRSYDVVITTDEEIPELDGGMLLIYASEIRSSDAQINIASHSRVQNAVLHHRGAEIPLYGDALTFKATGSQVVCTTATSDITGLVFNNAGPKVVRIGYDLFQEIEFLLTTGQPVENASIPTLELHIGMLRDLILDAGISVLEIPPTPAGYDFSACLTHDIDFVGIREHKFDHTMWGFLFRSTIGAIRDFGRRRISFGRLIRIWQSAASLPLVYLGWVKDFWIPFDWYLKIEKGLPATYFLIPFKKRAGDRVSVPHAERRATAYDISDIPEWTTTLIDQGCEIGVHGIDAWHSIPKGREELERVTTVTGASKIGVRMHWLLRDENTFKVLEESGYSYDSTAGYNETVGYRCGTTQAFRPLNTRRLLELPMHIQDGALFFPGRLDLPEPKAWELCQAMIQNARNFGGVLTVLWHDRSHGPERFWGDFYARLVQRLRSMNMWFGTAAQVVDWFRKRREVVFERIENADGTTRVKLCGTGQRIEPPLRIRVYFAEAASAGMQRSPGEDRTLVDSPWAGECDLELGRFARTVTNRREEAVPVSA